MILLQFDNMIYENNIRKKPLNDNLDNHRGFNNETTEKHPTTDPTKDDLYKLLKNQEITTDPKRRGGAVGTVYNTKNISLGI